MARLPLREAIFNALHQHLIAAFPDLTEDRVERNRTSEIGDKELLPRLIITDGGQAPTDVETPGEQEFLFEVEVQGHVSAPTDAEIGPAMNDLHARILEAMLPGEPILVLEVPFTRELWLEAADLTLDWIGVLESEVPGVSFTQGFTFRSQLPRGQAFVDLAD